MVSLSRAFLLATAWAAVGAAEEAKCPVCEDCSWTCAKAAAAEKAKNSDLETKATTATKEASRWRMQVEGLEDALSKARVELEEFRLDVATKPRPRRAAPGFAVGDGAVVVNATELGALASSFVADALGAATAAVAGAAAAGGASFEGPAGAAVADAKTAAAARFSAAAAEAAKTYEAAWAAVHETGHVTPAQRAAAEAKILAARDAAASAASAAYETYVVGELPKLWAAHAAPVVAQARETLAARRALAAAELEELRGVTAKALAEKRAALDAATPSRDRALELLKLTRYAIAKQFDATGAKIAALAGAADAAPAEEPSDGALRLATAGMACWFAASFALVFLSALALARALLALALKVAATLLGRALKTPVALVRLAVRVAFGVLKLAVKLVLFGVFLPLRLLFLPITLPLWLLSSKKKKPTSPAPGKARAKPKKNQR